MNKTGITFISNDDGNEFARQVGRAVQDLADTEPKIRLTFHYQTTVFNGRIVYSVLITGKED